jgi:hypothetical protein
MIRILIFALFLFALQSLQIHHLIPTHVEVSFSWNRILCIFSKIILQILMIKQFQLQIRFPIQTIKNNSSKTESIKTKVIQI